MFILSTKLRGKSKNLIMDKCIAGWLRTCVRRPFRAQLNCRVRRARLGTNHGQVFAESNQLAPR